VIVSHDEQLLSLACSQLWHCDGEGGVTQLHYGFDEYKERLRTGKSLDKK
jgi:ATPase subunit of ABC transporter with duplicated ATPase domains